MDLVIYNPTSITISKIVDGVGLHGKSVGARDITITDYSGSKITIQLYGDIADLKNITLPPIDDIADMDPNLPESLRRQAE